MTGIELPQCSAWSSSSSVPVKVSTDWQIALNILYLATLTDTNLSSCSNNVVSGTWRCECLTDCDDGWLITPLTVWGEPSYWLNEVFMVLLHYLEVDARILFWSQSWPPKYRYLTASHLWTSCHPWRRFFLSHISVKCRWNIRNFQRCTSETPVTFYEIIRRNIPGDSHLHFLFFWIHSSYW
jgi:hypothetical protein